MIDIIISKIILPLTLKGFNALFSFVGRLIADWLDGKKQDDIDRRNRDMMKEPNKPDVAGRLNGQFK